MLKRTAAMADSLDYEGLKRAVLPAVHALCLGTTSGETGPLCCACGGPATVPATVSLAASCSLPGWPLPGKQPGRARRCSSVQARRAACQAAPLPDDTRALPAHPPRPAALQPRCGSAPLPR